jgi:hypothetical protein
MLATATLDVAGFGSATDLWLVCDAKGALGLRPVEGDVSGLRVPAGRVRVVRAPPGQAPSADSGATQAEIELEAGSQGTLRAP